MEKNRKIKVLTIVALIVTLVGMSIGFAVFSDVLTINSSATVTPNEDDFKIMVYGFIDESEGESINNGNLPDLTKWSTTTAYQIKAVANSNESSFGSGKYNANIISNNKNIKIENIVGDFTEPGEAVAYEFIIKNEGEYDAYVNFSGEIANQPDDAPIYKTCVPGDGASSELVQNACNEIALLAVYKNKNGEDIENIENYKLSIGDHIYMSFVIWYLGDSRADGPFTMEFIDIEYDFTSAPKN